MMRPEQAGTWDTRESRTRTKTRFSGNPVYQDLIATCLPYSVGKHELKTTKDRGMDPRNGTCRSHPWVKGQLLSNVVSRARRWPRFDPCRRWLGFDTRVAFLIAIARP
jgi:hypothetical protein